MPTPIEYAEKKRMLAVHMDGAQRDDVDEQSLVAMFSCDIREGNGRIFAYKWFRIWVSNPSFGNAIFKEQSKGIEYTLTSEMSSDELAKGQRLADEWIKNKRT